MTKRLAVCAALILGLISSVSVSAAGLPPGKWWRRPEYIELLSLTHEQQTKLELIFRTAANDLIDLRAEADKTSIALRSELDQQQLNRENLRRLAEHLSETQGHLFSRELMMLVDMRTVLSDDQWTRLRMELDRDMGRRGPPKQH